MLKVFQPPTSTSDAMRRGTCIPVRLRSRRYRKIRARKLGVAFECVPNPCKGLLQGAHPTLAGMKTMRPAMFGRFVSINDPANPYSRPSSVTVVPPQTKKA